MRTLLRIFFGFLYHQLAFAYDFVAASVSFGHWKNWILEVVPFITGTRTLEIGHGPGHLQRFLLSRGLDSVAIDESSSMGRLAQRNTGSVARLTRGLAQYLPFADQSFDTVIATFPSEYFVDPLTLSEVKRCLSDRGRFIVLPAAMPKNRFLKWLYKITGESPQTLSEAIQSRMSDPFIKSGFDVKVNFVELKSGTLWIIMASKIRELDNIR